MTATKYTCQCTRCDGTGRYDIGTCFDCHGVGFVNSANTRGLIPFVLEVTFENGSKNFPRVFASRRTIAVQIVERMLRIKGWNGVVATPCAITEYYADRNNSGQAALTAHR